MRDALRGFQDASERAPDRYIRYEYPALLDASRAAAAAYLGVPADDVVVVPNVTTALNAVLRNLAPSFREGDVILYVDTVYGATLKTIEYVAEISPVEAVRVEFELPGPGPGSAAAAEEQVLGAFRGAFAAHRGRVRVAVFDTIASLPGVRLPFEEMQRIAREEGAMTLVDGARRSSLCPVLFLKTGSLTYNVSCDGRRHGAFPPRPHESRPRLLHDQLPQVRRPPPRPVQATHGVGIFRVVPNI